MERAEVIVRNAVTADAAAMGRLHVRAWQWGYRGVMPDAYLDGLNADDRTALWRDRIGATGLPPILVAELTTRGQGGPVATGADEVVGFAAFGTESSATTNPCGELYALNIDPDHWGRGIGRALLNRATDWLVDLGHAEAVLWVVPENARARALYESEGWVSDGAVATEEIHGVTVTDIRYRKRLR